MIKQILIITLGLLANSNLCHAQDYWNHHDQQGDVASCHSFATIALVEAEYWKETGKHINLSEKDLFVRHLTRDHSSIHSFLSKQLSTSMKAKQPTHHLESGHIEDDFKILKRHGVASERELPYTPLFRRGLSISINHIRYQRDRLTDESSQLKRQKLWNKSRAEERLQHYLKKLASAKVPQALKLSPDSKTSQLTRQFVQAYTLRKITPKSTPQAKQLIIQQVQQQPVALDITNYSEITKVSNPLHSNHSLIVSHYNPLTDQFTVRSSTTKRATEVSADTLSRGTYRLYFLEKS